MILVFVTISMRNVPLKCTIEYQVTKPFNANIYRNKSYGGTAYSLIYE